MANSIGEIKEEIGKTPIPALDEAAKAFLPVLQAVGAWIAEYPELTKTIGLIAVSIGGLTVVLGSLMVTMGGSARQPMWRSVST